jgi:hypothetical protein
MIDKEAFQSANKTIARAREREREQSFSHYHIEPKVVKGKKVSIVRQKKSIGEKFAHRLHCWALTSSVFVHLTAIEVWGQFGQQFTSNSMVNLAYNLQVL